MSSGNGKTHRPPDRLADRYEVREQIGEGASAITYRGWDERLERVVAIKILRQAFASDESFVRRFRQEARSAASVSHGNVVDVYDFGQEDGALFIVMQYVDGEDLKHLIRREAPLESRRVRSITAHVLEGLQAIHASGIVHRDIKPQNVLIGHDGIARVTDFGVAHIDEDTGLTTAGTTVGTAAYMAPEQAQGGRVSEATDLYAVGVMLYEMLTGYLPFNGPTAMATMLEHIQSEPVPPSQRLPGRGITPAMDSVVLQALSKQPDRRFKSARAMRQALNQVFSGGTRPGDQPTVAVPVAQSTMHAAGTAVAPPVRVRPRDQRAAPSAYGAAHATTPDYEDRRPARDEGAGMNGAVRALLTVIALGIFAVLAWFLFENLQDEDRGGGATHPTATVEATEAPQPTATDVPAGAIEPLPTATTEPTVAPTETPEPTESPEPTPEPTETPEPTATVTPAVEDVTEEQPPIIEPIDITPFPTESGQGRVVSDEDDKRLDKKDRKVKKDDKTNSVVLQVVLVDSGGTAWALQA